MAESGELGSYADSDSDSFLSGSVDYSTDGSDDDSASDSSILPEFEVTPYRFEPERVVNDTESEPMGDSGEEGPGVSDGRRPE